jgi:hypothetical protein
VPFTVSHAAAALPFRKLKPIWPALVIGTLAPDFEYFLRLSDEDRTGHHFPGVVTFSLPLALLVFWLFEAFVREPIMELLPVGVQRRLPSPAKSNPKMWKTFAIVFGWIVCGIATHLAWDWCTHPHTWIWDHWAWLQQRVAIPFHRPVVMNKLVQLASSLFGLAALAIWFAIWYRHEIPAGNVQIRQLAPTRKFLIVGSMAALSVGAGCPLAYWRLLYLDPAMNPVGVVTTIVEAVILLFTVQILLYGIVRTYARRPERNPAKYADATRIPEANPGSQGPI